MVFTSVCLATACSLSSSKATHLHTAKMAPIIITNEWTMSYRYLIGFNPLWINDAIWLQPSFQNGSGNGRFGEFAATEWQVVLVIDQRGFCCLQYNIHSCKKHELSVEWLTFNTACTIVKVWDRKYTTAVSSWCFECDIQLVSNVFYNRKNQGNNGMKRIG